MERSARPRDSRSSLEAAVEKRRSSSADRPHRGPRRIHGPTHYAALEPMDLVIETATENLEIKTERIMTQADQICATTRCSPAIPRRLDHGTRRRDRAPRTLHRMHFFNPVPLMALVRADPRLLTSDVTQVRATEFISRNPARTAINVKNSPGFAVTAYFAP